MGFGLGVQAEQSDFLREWEAVEARPRIVVMPNRRIIWRNPAALRFFAMDLGLHDRESLLAADDGAANAALEAALGAGHDGIELCLPTRSPDEFAIISGVRLRPAATDGVWGLTLCLTGRRTIPAPRYAAYDVAFSLTPAERRVADALIDGLEPIAIAEKHGAAVTTVRTHIRSIYTKMAVTSQQQFHRRIAAFRMI